MKRHPLSAWFAVLVAAFYGVLSTVRDGFDWAYALAFVYAACWLSAEYQLRRDEAKR